MNTILQDFRHALRSLMKTPSLTLAAVLSLGLGIGANTTVFSWVQAVVFRPIPGALEPGTIYVTSIKTREGRDRSWSYPSFRDYRDRARLVDVVAQDDLTMSIAIDGQAERAYGGIVGGNYFQVMGIQPALGRLISPEDDRKPGGHPVVVLSHAYWQNRFAAAPGIIGKPLMINNTPMTVIGVAQEGFLGSFLGVRAAAWVPMAMQPQMMGSDRLEARNSGWMQAYVRLRPGVSLEQARAEATTVIEQLEREFPSNEGRRLQIVPPWQAQFGAPQVLAPILGVLSVVVGLVLLIACANVANLLLSRAGGRRREIAVRLSLGANRWRIVRQLLTEAVLLAAAAGAVGITMTYWTYGLLMTFAPPTDMPIDFGLGIDRATLGYAVAVSLATGLFFGLAPAWQASGPDTVHALKEEAGRGTSGGRTGHRLRNTLVVAQVAVCLVLLVGASLFVRSLQAAEQMTPGFAPEDMLVASIDLFPNGYTPDTGRQFHGRLEEAMRGVPGVTSFALGREVPLGLSGGSSSGVAIDGYAPRPNEEVNVSYNVVGPRYFATMKIPLVSGREFAEQDTRETPRVLIVNETMAKRYWAGRDALGGRVRIGKDDYQVVAVAKDIKYRQLAEDPQPYMYFALEQSYASNVALHVRSADSPATMLATVRDKIRSLDPNLPIFDARTVSEHMRTAVFAQRMGANLLGAMGVLALLLAAVGLYGVIAYAVSQRTQEMGVRLALGAAPRDLLTMVLRQGLVLTTVGLAIGLTLAFAATGFMRSLLPGIAPRDPLTFIGVPLVLIAIATLAVLIPARRAGSVDPVVALRYE